MKRLLTLIVAVIFIFTFSISAFASNSNEQYIPKDSIVTYWADGSYLVTTMTIDSKNDYSKGLITNTISGTKSMHYYSDENQLEWEYHLTGTFYFVPGISAECIGATHSKTIHSDNWSLSNESTYYENNVAHGNGTFKKKVLFVTVKTIDVDLSITCDTNGNLSK